MSTNEQETPVVKQENQESESDGIADSKSLIDTISKTDDSLDRSRGSLDPAPETDKTRKLQAEDETQLKRPKTALSQPPVHEMVGGSSVRQYLNENLTQHLLEGLREVSKNKPEDPLRALGTFLIECSNQLKE